VVTTGKRRLAARSEAERSGDRTVASRREDDGQRALNALPRERTEISANGLHFTADVAGDPDAPLVLLLHGFPQTRYTWRHQLPALAAAGYRAVAPDQRGYSPGARPSGVENYAVEALIGDALAIAGASGAQRLHLVGHDWGGQLAWLLAARHPERVHTLTMLSRPHPAAFARALASDPKQSERSKHHRAFQDPSTAALLIEEDARRLRRMLRDHGVPDADAAAYIAPLSTHAAIDAALNWYRASYRGTSGLAMAETPAVRAPTLFLWGDADQTVGRQAAEATRDFVIGPYRFVVVPGVGHFITDQAAEVVTKELLAHLAANAGA
jgi:pimeloyl-ACP methyl ester carboxylesterase